ncbi:MAG TPA: Crp/Fnr family transcriptional regulator [Puia sp.]|uniref:Crp/Fnr family transcriptional regulator n=1 Tax=Puia sp. TaxID=2045100 RepID=UPI002BC3E2F7|nr:Crp/Fnr family transcriptional regulator [Puia sp.]HVU98050.1 Crp/Fnr family transcriptional regulator [Puia sp.]
MYNEIRDSFPSFESALLKSIEANAVVKRLPEGEKIVKTGQYFKSILLIVEGLIKVYREDEEGNEYFMYYLEPGQGCVFSMIHTGRPEKSGVMGKVVKDTTIVALPPENLNPWMQQYKTWYEFVIQSYRKDFEKLLATFDHTAFRNMDAKLLHYLRREREIHKKNLLLINKAEIARELNTSREVISRLMRKLAERGMIKMLKKQFIEIINLDM